MSIEKKTHDEEHNSVTNPTTGCVWCIEEIYRRTHRCFGEGKSSLPNSNKPDTESAP